MLLSLSGQEKAVCTFVLRLLGILSMLSGNDLLDFLGNPTKKDIQEFCQRCSFDEEVFGLAYHTGNALAINELSQALIKDIDNSNNKVHAFHKDTVLQMLYWYKAAGKGLIPDSFIMLLHKIFYPENQFQRSLSRTKREFLASFSALAQIKENSRRNVSLIARAYIYARNLSEHSDGRKDVREYFKEEAVCNMEAEFLEAPAAAEDILKMAFMKIRQSSSNTSHQNIAEQKMGEALWLNDHEGFEEIYSAVKYLSNY